jgi:trehalose 6-phosphate phosphatase
MRDGAIERLPGAALPPTIGPRLEAIAAALPGVLIEAKGISTALHYRQAPQHRAALHAALLALATEFGDGVELMPGHSVFEVKPRGSTKGTAIAGFMNAAPFAGRIPVFAGDDRTDEDGFAAVIARGGHAIRVGPEGATSAPWRIADPARMRAWLGEIARSLALT